MGLLWSTTCSRLRPSLYRARCQVPGSMYSMKPVSWRPLSSRPLGALEVEMGSVNDLGSAFPSSSFTKSNWTQFSDTIRQQKDTNICDGEFASQTLRSGVWLLLGKLYETANWMLSEHCLPTRRGWNNIRCGYLQNMKPKNGRETVNHVSSVQHQTCSEAVGLIAPCAANSMGRLYHPAFQTHQTIILSGSTFLCFFSFPLNLFNFPHHPRLSLLLHPQTSLN